MLHLGTCPRNCPPASHSICQTPTKEKTLLQVYVTFSPHVTLSVFGVLLPFVISAMSSHIVTTKENVWHCKYRSIFVKL